ncbi:hypothetical protein AAMO2058_001479900 [Amorphochlora amoebiformis]
MSAALRGPSDELASPSEPVKGGSRSLRAKSLDWLGAEEEKDREKFLILLSTQRLPCPQCERDWHAARVYVDSLKKAVYDVEQWTDYLSLKNKLPIADKVSQGGARRGTSGRGRPKNLSSPAISRPHKTTPKPPPPSGPPPQTTATSHSKEAKFQRAVTMLVEMGFTDVEMNQAVVVACGGDFQSALEMILQANNSTSNSSKRAKSFSHAPKQGTTHRPSPPIKYKPILPTQRPPSRKSEFILAQCARCRAKLRIHSSIRTFICGVCKTECQLSGDVRSHGACIGCNSMLRYRPADTLIKCPICSIVIETKSWTPHRYTPTPPPSNPSRFTTKPQSTPPLRPQPVVRPHVSSQSHHMSTPNGDDSETDVGTVHDLLDSPKFIEGKVVGIEDPPPKNVEGKVIAIEEPSVNVLGEVHAPINMKPADVSKEESTEGDEKGSPTHGTASV